MLDRDMRWVVEPGVFRVMVGARRRTSGCEGSSSFDDDDLGDVTSLGVTRREFVVLAAAGLVAGRLAVDAACALGSGRRRAPVPSPAQLAWQRDELALFLHFGVNTFTDREWGDGKERPGDLRAVARSTRGSGRARRRRGGFRR